MLHFILLQCCTSVYCNAALHSIAMLHFSLLQCCTSRHFHAVIHWPIFAYHAVRTRSTFTYLFVAMLEVVQDHTFISVIKYENHDFIMIQFFCFTFSLPKVLLEMTSTVFRLHLRNLLLPPLLLRFLLMNEMQ